VSKHLVKRWRRLAREWSNAADYALNTAAERAACSSKAEAFDDCADSLERSLTIAERKKAKR
jgi:hypothetical protein